jgi:hypothetical protein
MKLTDFIVGLFFVLIIGYSVYAFPRATEILNIAAGPYILSIAAWIILFLFICCVRFNMRFERPLFLLYIIFAFTGVLWKYGVAEMGVGELLFRCLVFVFFAYIMLTGPWQQDAADEDESG